MEAQKLIALDSKAFASDSDLMVRVLKPYKENCKYLKSADVFSEGDPLDGGRVIGRCEFSIPESCYIDDTGHFNSVEFNICYNQMMYYVVAKSVKERLMSSFVSWTMDDYWQKQLPDIFIVNFESSFKKSMKSHRFFGVIEFNKVRKRSGLLFINTACQYWDQNNGSCSGKVNLAILNTSQQ
ncbi:MAG: FcoT family thioesterase [Pseudomonadota bacterium]